MFTTTTEASAGEKVETADVEDGSNEKLVHSLTEGTKENDENGEGAVLVTSVKEKEGEEGEQSEQVMVPALSEDAYSLIYAARLWSHAFIFGCFVATFQLAIITLVLFDLIEAPTNNPLQIPPGVDAHVTAAQGLAVILAAATNEDLFVALIRFMQGYENSSVKNMIGVTRAKWALATGWQMISGFSMLTVIFILVMQSDSVIGMFLNFAALAFISEIDNVAFALGKHGFVTTSVQHSCERVCAEEIPRKHKYSIWRRIIFLFICSILLIFYGVLAHQQRSGKFLCQNILVQMSDEHLPILPAFSGVYSQSGNLINNRVTYVGRKGNRRAMFAYCESIDAWTFTFALPNEEGSLDPCKWYARSEETRTYDITETLVWLTLNEDRSESLTLVAFYMACNDCDGGGGPCSSSYGECVLNRCICNKGRFGLNCEFEDPCPYLSEDQRLEPVPIRTFWDIDSSGFELLRLPEDRLVTVYHRPVYVTEYSSGTKSGLAVLLYTGRRWVLTEKHFFSKLSGLETSGDVVTGDNVTREQLAEYLDTEFHGFYSSPYFPLYISSKADIKTPTDTVSPVNLNWFRAQTNDMIGIYLSAVEVDETQPINSNFLCKVCNNSTNRCYNYNQCNVDQGECDCIEGYSGSLCEGRLPCVDIETGCRNGGNCTPEVKPFCSCAPQYFGNVCEFKYD